MKKSNVLKFIMLIFIFILSLSLFSGVYAKVVTVENESSGTEKVGWWIFAHKKNYKYIDIKIESGYFTSEEITMWDGLIQQEGNKKAIQVVPTKGGANEETNAFQEIRNIKINEDGTVSMTLVIDEEYGVESVSFETGEFDENGNYTSSGNSGKYNVEDNNSGEVENNNDNQQTQGGSVGKADEGSDENPYIVSVGNVGEVFEIEYKTIPFYFAIDDGSAEGTFLVDWDEENKKVTLKYISNKNEVGYVKEHENDDEYQQVGATSVNLAKHGITSETVPKYLIKEYNQGSFSVTPNGEMDLKNGFNYLSTVTTSYVQHKASYVFVRARGYKTADRDNYVMYQFCGVEEPEEPAGKLETLCTRVLAFLGDLFLAIIKTFLGKDVTIDKIIFNEYEPVVIDLDGTRGGVFGNGSVRSMISSIYSMFVAIAIAVYTTMLLYIGVKVLFTVSTPRQSEYRKDLTNWIVGLVALLIIPQFFKYVPQVVNAIVEYMGSNRVVMNTYYNMDVEMDSDKIGTSGEDTRSTYIERLKGLRAQKEEQREEEQKNIDVKSGDLKDIFLAAIEQYWSIIDSQDEPGEEVKKRQAAEAVEKMKNYILNNPKAFVEYDENDTPISNDDGAPVLKEVTTSEVINWGLGLPLLNENKEAIVNSLNNGGLASSIYISEQLTEDIEKIDALLDAPDLMGDMRVLAGQTGRFTYAVVWWICIYEMIVILCMYFRRAIVMVMLVIMYPLVAMTYPIDKLKDGKAQTFTNWYKEFTVNMVVQIAHAVVYLILVQTGIELYKANANNWLFFLLSVLFLFPAERILRGIFGLKGTSIAVLKGNAVGVVGAAATAITLGKQVGRATNEKFGITKSGKQAKAAKANAETKARNKRDAKDRYLQDRADTKERIRKQKAAQRRRNAAGMSGSRRMAYDLYAKTRNAASSVRSAAYKVGNKGRVLKGKYRNLQDSKFAKYAKGTWHYVRGATGVAVGAANFVTSAGKSGLATGFVTGVETAKLVGGFKDREKLKKAIDNRTRTSTPSAATGTTVGGASGSRGGATAGVTSAATAGKPSVSAPPSAGGGTARTSATTTTTTTTNTTTTTT